MHKKAPELIRGFFVCPEGFEPPSARPNGVQPGGQNWNLQFYPCPNGAIPGGPVRTEFSRAGIENCVYPEGFEPPSAEPESAILSIELWAL